MELQETNVTAKTEYSGNDVITVPTGKTLTIETSPTGVEILSKTNNSGSDWTVRIDVVINESA